MRFPTNPIGLLMLCIATLGWVGCGDADVNESQDSTKGEATLPTTVSVSAGDKVNFSVAAGGGNSGTAPFNISIELHYTAQ